MTPLLHQYATISPDMTSFSMTRDEGLNDTQEQQIVNFLTETRTLEFISMRNTKSLGGKYSSTFTKVLKETETLKTLILDNIDFSATVPGK